MALDTYLKKNKPVRRSFVLPPEIVEALQQIQLSQGFDNPSQALRYCVAATYEQLARLERPEVEEALAAQVEQVNTTLKFLLIEIIKAHGGKESLDAQGVSYLKKLNKEIKAYKVKKVNADEE